MKGVLIVNTAAPMEPINSREIYAIQTDEKFNKFADDSTYMSVDCYKFRLEIHYHKGNHETDL